MTHPRTSLTRLQADPKFVNLCQTLMVMALISIPFWAYVAWKLFHAFRVFLEKAGLVG